MAHLRELLPAGRVKETNFVGNGQLGEPAMLYTDEHGQGFCVPLHRMSEGVMRFHGTGNPWQEDAEGGGSLLSRPLPREQ